MSGNSTITLALGSQQGARVNKGRGNKCPCKEDVLVIRGCFSARLGGDMAWCPAGTKSLQGPCDGGPAACLQETPESPELMKYRSPVS